MTKSNADGKGHLVIPQLSVNKFLQHVEERAWTDAEKELDLIRQNSDGSAWSRGYVKALEGLLLTYRNNEDKYVYIPKALASRSEETVNSLRKEFGEFASIELHADYDRGFFKALEDYLILVATLKSSTLIPISPPNSSGEKPVKDERRE